MGIPRPPPKNKPTRTAATAPSFGVPTCKKEQGRRENLSSRKDRNPYPRLTPPWHLPFLPPWSPQQRPHHLRHHQQLGQQRLHHRIRRSTGGPDWLNIVDLSSLDDGL